MLGDRLKELRTSQGITQKELAKQLGVSASAVGLYEQNRREPDISTIKKLAKLLNCNVDYLLGFTSIPTPTKSAIYTTSESDEDLPDEAKKELESFKQYIKQKYKK